MKKIILEHRISFFEENNEDEIGYVDFEIKEDSMILTHTFVNDAFRGQGIAGKLMEESLIYAKEHGYTILPQCSYAVLYFDKHPQ